MRRCAKRSIKVRKQTGQTDRRTDGRQIVTLRSPLKAGSIMKVLLRGLNPTIDVTDVMSISEITSFSPCVKMTRKIGFREGPSPKYLEGRSRPQ